MTLNFLTEIAQKSHWHQNCSAPGKMWLAASLIIVLSAFQSFDLLNFFAFPASTAHSFCQKLISDESLYPFMYRAMVCGSDIPDAQITNSLRRTALIHLIVVSGAHLILLEQGLGILEKKLKSWPRWLTPLFLVVYSFMTLLNPPITRALIQKGISFLSRRHDLNWTPTAIIIISGAVSLLFFPAWWNSLSFQLSLLASLGLEVARLAKRSQHLVVYLLLAPALAQISIPHPATILLNAALTPIFGFILLPTSWLALLCPPAIPITDFVWYVFLNAVRILSDLPFQLTSVAVQNGQFWRWLYIAAAQVTAIAFSRWRYRAW